MSTQTLSRKGGCVQLYRVQHQDPFPLQHAASVAQEAQGPKIVTGRTLSPSTVGLWRQRRITQNKADMEPTLLDLFDDPQKAIDHALWLNFKYRIAKIRFGVIYGPERGWAVCEMRWEPVSWT